MTENLLRAQSKGLLMVMLSLILGFAQAQTQVLTGKILDESGTGLPGVNILVKGSSLGTTTDANGTFNLEVGPSDNILVVSFIGYRTSEVVIGNQTSITVSLAPDAQQLSEVVVVGYGELEKKDLTGSVSSVSAKDLTKVQVSSVDQALQGQIAGVQINTTSGAPGGNVNVLIRGVSSISGGVQPLFVVDGFPISNVGIGNPLNTLNPNDIESVDVLKDASATAIYGSRGSNGVIIITTKRGKSGAPKIELNSYVGFQEVSKKIDLMNAQEYAQFVIDGRNAGYLDNFPAGNINDNNATRPGVNYDVSDKYRNAASLTTTDWQDAIFRRAAISNHQLSITGGTDAVRYAISGGYFNQDGIIINSGLERYNFSANVDAKVSNKVTVGFSLLPSYTSQQDVPTSGHTGELGMINSALSMDPSIPVYNEDGSYGNSIPPTDGNVAIQNPVKIANELKINASQFRMLANAYVDYAILPELKLRTTFGTDLNYFKDSRWNPSTLASSAVVGPATASANTWENVNWLSETTLSYKKQLGADHRIDFVGGFTAQKETSQRINVSANNFADDLIENINGGIVNAGYQNTDINTLMSVLGRVNYAFKDRYLVTATVRSDGSSRFGKNNRWGTFPSASIGWRVSQEGFMSDVAVVQDVKIRASYGTTGNNAIGNYRSVSFLGSNNYVIGNAVTPGLAPVTFANDNLTWEFQSQLNVGLDFSVANGRVNFTGDIYDKRNKDMLFNVQTPSATGFTNALVNLGEVQNKGLELAVGTRNFVGKFQWSTNVNVTFNKNEVLAMSSDAERIFAATGGRGNTNITQVGDPIGVFFGRRAVGVFQSDAEAIEYGAQPLARAGDIKWADTDNNGIINDNDREVIGSPHPDFYFGFNNTFSYKGFTLDIVTNGMVGMDVYSAVFAINNSGVHNNAKFVDEARWRSPEQPGTNDVGGVFGRAIRGGRNANTTFSSAYIFDASYWRIRNVSLGYSFPSTMLSKFKIQQARLYIAVNNLYTFTKYFGYDPEVGNAGGNQQVLGVDWGTYPMNRTSTIGLNITL